MKSVVLRVGCLIMLIAASGPATAATAASGSIVHRPRIPVEAPTGAGWASSNWSGYAKTGSGFSAATGSWVVQAVSPSRGASYSSQWVGIDGFNNNDLIQTGTESDYYSGRAHYDAWWEILPAAETVIPSITVRPGDVMSASVTQVSGTFWRIDITDKTTGQTFSTTQTYTGPRTSAEWVEEAPTVGGRVATLAHYGLTTFDPGALNGKDPGLTSADSGVMIQKNRQVSTPSTPDRDTDGFNMQYGSTAPAPPPS